LILGAGSDIRFRQRGQKVFSDALQIAPDSYMIFDIQTAVRINFARA
jgi:hypothetical protein